MTKPLTSCLKAIGYSLTLTRQSIMLERPLILVVDDDPAILKSAQDLLEAAGYLVDTAANGREPSLAWKPVRTR